MTIENGAAEAANDTVVADNTAASQVTADNAADQADNELEDDGGDLSRPNGGENGEPEWAEIEIEGKKYRVEAGAKDGYLRQADYTRKTQEVAESKRALEAREQDLTSRAETQQSHFKAATRLAAIEDRLGEYAEVKDGVIRPKFNWASEYQKAFAVSGTDNGQALSNYHHHKAVYDQMMEDHRLATDDLSKLESKRRSDVERDSANRIGNAQADIAKHLKGWAPGNDLDRKVSEFGISLGYTPQALAQLAIQHPTLVRDLNELRVFREAAAKQKLKQTFDESQAAQPVTRVGGNGGSANARKTTDASGDGLSAEEWVKRENERVAKLRQSSGRR